ncbi:MAG: DUF835 domain-containing protein [Halobacteria archaeon]
MSFHLLAAVPALSGAVVLAAGVHVLRKGGHRRDTRAFFLFTLFIFLTALSSFLLRTTPGGEELGSLKEQLAAAIGGGDVEAAETLGVRLQEHTDAVAGTALLWGRLLYFSHVLGVSFLLLTVTEFLEVRVLRRPSVALGFQAGTLLLALFAALSVNRVGFFDFGMAVHPRDIPVLASIVPAFSLAAFFLLLRAWLGSTGDLRGRLTWALVGLAPPILLGSATAATRIAYGLYLPPIVNYGAVVTAFAFGFGVFRRRLWVQPAPPVAADTSPRYVLTPGASFLIRERKPALCFQVLGDLVAHGAQGLCVTRTLPGAIRGMERLRETPVVWVGEQSPSPGIQSVEGDEEAAYTVAKFLAQCDTGRGVVLLDCLEYLVQTAGFRRSLKMVYHLTELVGRHGGRLIVSVNPDGLQPNELALLEKELLPFPETARPGGGR